MYSWSNDVAPFSHIHHLGTTAHDVRSIAQALQVKHTEGILVRKQLVALDLPLEHGGAGDQALLEHLELGGLGCHWDKGLRLLHKALLCYQLDGQGWCNTRPRA